MPILPDIRSHYRPAQPALRQSTMGVSYREYLPSIALQPYIYCYWQLQTDYPLSESFHYRVVADGCIDIFFEHQQSKNCFIMGFCKKYTIFPLEPEFDYIGIRFLPGMFPQLFNIPAQALSNHFEALENILPDLAQLITTQISPDTNLINTQQLIDNYILNKIEHIQLDSDTRFYDALLFIMKNQGVVSTGEDLQTGISPRQLRRIFNYYIGTTPKTFSKVVRFQHILNAKPSSQSLRQNPLFYDVGFYDQAHFIKDFKILYGVTPTEAFR